MANRVEETVGALRQFASDAAHELHTPLTALHTNLELAAAEQGARADSGASIGQAWEQMQRLEHLTSGLLDLSRIESGAASPSEPLEVGELVRETCEPYASQAEQNGIDFKLELPRQEAWMSGQRGRISRALSNLLGNAVKFTASGGSIRVGACGEPDEVRIWVEDWGSGSPRKTCRTFSTVPPRAQRHGVPGQRIGPGDRQSGGRAASRANRGHPAACRDALRDAPPVVERQPKLEKSFTTEFTEKKPETTEIIFLKSN